MMGTKARIFAPIAVVSLEDLVPNHHFYRCLDRTRDLSFVRDLVKKTFAHGGRPSLDPVVYFKLQLVMFFEDIRSERLLMQLVADKLSVRWYVGYNLNEPLPDHSSLTRIRERYGVEVFRRFFEQIVQQCQEAGLVWGKELYIDATKVQANASVDSLKPRFFVEAHLADLFGAEAEEPAEKTDQQMPHTEVVANQPVEQEETTLPTPLPVALSQQEQEALVQHNAERHDWIEQLGAQDRSVTHRSYQRMADLRMSTTDPDPILMLTKHGADMGYHTHYVVDGGFASPIVASDKSTNPARRVAEHGRNLIWRVALLYQPQDVPMRSLDGIGRASVAFVQLCCCQIGRECDSFGHASILHYLNGFDIS